MAKVEALHCNRNYDWETRLIGLINAVSSCLLEKGEEGTDKMNMSLYRRGMRFNITTRYWGRGKHHDTCITLYGRNSDIIMSVRNTKLTGLADIKTKQPSTDYKKAYKLLERRVYAMFSGDQASEIMSRGDDLYNIIGLIRDVKIRSLQRT